MCREVHRRRTGGWQLLLQRLLSRRNNRIGGFGSVGTCSDDSMDQRVSLFKKKKAIGNLIQKWDSEGANSARANSASADSTVAEALSDGSGAAVCERA
jgi:hypothetical protein